MAPLGLMSEGEYAEVVTSSARMEDVGLRVGKRVHMLKNGGRGPVLIKVDESRIALSRAVAMKIMVSDVIRATGGSPRAPEGSGATRGRK